eukprot:388264-Rhodomonas_salina.1
MQAGAKCTTEQISGYQGPTSTTSTTREPGRYPGGTGTRASGTRALPGYPGTRSDLLGQGYLLYRYPGTRVRIPCTHEYPGTVVAAAIIQEPCHPSSKQGSSGETAHECEVPRASVTFYAMLWAS